MVSATAKAEAADQLDRGAAISARLASSRSRGARSLLIDALRAIALVRIVAWHLYSEPFLTYFAAIPVMFFCGGLLVARSVDRAPYVTVMRRRFRRVLIPFWVFAVAAWLAFASHSLAQGTRLTGSTAGAIAWILPLWDPTGPHWATALWAPLWYVRMYLWLILLTPLLVRAMRRHPVVTLGACAVATVTCGLLDVNAEVVPDEVQRLVAYTLAWGLGVAYAQGRLLRLTRLWLLLGSVLAVGAGAAWMATREVPLGIVNVSPTAEMLFGLGLVFGALALAPAIEAVARARRVMPFVSVLNRRALTVYLWHGVAVFVAIELARDLDLDGLPRVLFLAAFAVVLVASFVTTVGWVEDIAASRRQRHRRPVRVTPVRSLVAAVTAISVGVGVTAASADADGPRSQRSVIPGSGAGLTWLVKQEVSDRASTTTSQPRPVSTNALTDAELQSALDAWRQESGISGVTVAIRRDDGSGWAGASGIDDRTGKAMEPGALVPTHSYTKTFTSALVMLLEQRGRLTLDDPLARWVPDFPHADEITLRELLMHRSGLREADQPPREAIEEAKHQSLAFPPGTDTGYSDVGYFLLGMVIERAGGKSYSAQLHALLRQAGLRHTVLDDEVSPTAVDSHPDGSYQYFGSRWSAGGVYATVADQAAWAAALFTGRVLDAAHTDALLRLSPESHIGLGVWGFCPCWRDLTGALRARRYGHLTTQGLVAFQLDDGLSVAVYTNEPASEVGFKAWLALHGRMHLLAFGRPLPGSQPAAG